MPERSTNEWHYFCFKITQSGSIFAAPFKTGEWINEISAYTNVHIESVFFQPPVSYLQTHDEEDEQKQNRCVHEINWKIHYFLEMKYFCGEYWASFTKTMKTFYKEHDVFYIELKKD